MSDRLSQLQACRCCGREAGPLGPLIDEHGLCDDEFCQLGQTRNEPELDDRDQPVRSGPPWRCPVCNYQDAYGSKPFMCVGPADDRHPPREVIPA